VQHRRWWTCDRAKRGPASNAWSDGVGPHGGHWSNIEDGGPMSERSEELGALVAAVEAALDDPGLADEPAMVDAMRPAMAALLSADGSAPEAACEPLPDGSAVGNLLYSDSDRRFPGLAVGFPGGRSAGAPRHGC